VAGTIYCECQLPKNWLGYGLENDAETLAQLSAILLAGNNPTSQPLGEGLELDAEQPGSLCLG